MLLGGLVIASDGTYVTGCGCDYLAGNDLTSAKAKAVGDNYEDINGPSKE